MITHYDSNLKAHATTDENKKILHLRHSQEYWLSEQNIPRLTASDYLNEMAEVMQIPKEELKNLNTRVSFLQPRIQEVEYHLSEEKHLFDSITVGYYQTYLNVPVWRKGISVKVKQNPSRIISSTNNSEDDLHGTLPDEEIIERYKQFFRQVIVRQALVDAGLDQERIKDDSTPFLLKLLKISNRSSVSGAKEGRSRSSRNETQILSGKFFTYKYDSQKRYAGKSLPVEVKTNRSSLAEGHDIPIPRLPPVSDKIKKSQTYLVAEIVFVSNLGGFGGISWLILVEIETGSILYIECMTSGVNGLVFRRDPMVKTGDLTITSDDSNAILNPHRDTVPLSNLNAPTAGTQNLRGTYVDIEELTVDHANPDIAVPTQPSGMDFNYEVRTSEFGAVNAYYHQTELFKTIESLGFPISTYLDGTTFPIPVDHRALNDEINAHCVGNTSGTLHMCYGLGDLTNTTNPVCRSVDPWVHWHEMGGHGMLYDHVGGANLGFSHSAGDGLAALQMDPESALRGLPERFRYAPFRPSLDRWFNRDVSTWAWGGGPNDDGGYGSEQILATCHFRIYRSIGGDHNDLARRQFASRMVTYLILRTIGNLTSMTNPSNWNPATMVNEPGRGAQLWCEEMQDTDLEDWTSEGLAGGAYNKVIRWSFEKQGSYQPVGSPSPVTTAGNPPAIDIYIDDGRAGEYQFQAVHWQNMSIWNRNTSDGLSGHQNAIEGVTNFIYGKVKNRGTLTANNITIRSYHSLPGAGLTWPNDFIEMGPIGGLTVSSIAANSTEEVVVGPFEWVPNINVYGHDCVLMIASVAGDPSNVDNFTPTESIAEWRLVPNDNNIAQRNVSVLPGGGGPEALMAALDGAIFFAGNSLNKPANMEIKVEVPRVLATKGWNLLPQDNKFKLRAGEKRKIELNLTKGTTFTSGEIKSSSDKEFNVYLYGNNILLGGMTYHIDSDLKAPSGGKPDDRRNCNGAAQNLLDCLKISGDTKVKRVCVKNVSIDIELNNNCKCD